MKKFLTYLFVLFTALLVGISLATSNYSMLVCIVSLAIAFVMARNIKLTIYSVILTVFLFDWLSQYMSLLPRQLTWMPEMLALILLGRIAFDVANKKIQIQNNFITHFVYLWLILSIVGAVVNSLNPLVFIVGLRNYFKFVPLLFAFSWYQFPDKFVQRVVRVVIAISVVQILFVIPEQIIFYGITRDWGDYVVGSLGGNASGTLAIFQILVFSILAALYRSNYYSLKKFLIYGGLILLPTFITEAKVIFVLLPLTFLVSFLDFRGRMFARRALLVLLGAVVVIAGGYIYNSIYARRLGRDVGTIILSRERLLDQLGAGKIAYDDAGQLRRLSAVHFMFENIDQDTYTRMFGVGIGNASNSLFEVSRGKYHKKYPVLRIADVSLAGVGWEFGYAGLALFGVFFFTLCIVRPRNRHDPFSDGMFRGVRALVLIAAVCFIYTSFLTINALAFVFWLYLGILNNRLLNEKVSVPLALARARRLGQ